MSVVAPRAAPVSINWHLSRTETLPMYFGFAEKKPMAFEHINIHRLSLTRLDEEFYILRNPELIAIAVTPTPAEPSASDDYASLSKPDSSTLDSLAKPDDNTLLEYVGDSTSVPAAKSFTDNLTFDAVDEPITVADVSVALPSHLKADADLTKDALPSHPDKLEEEPVAVSLPVAEPVDPALKAGSHHGEADKEERLEEERAAAISAAQGGGSLTGLHAALDVQAEQVAAAHEASTSDIVIPVAEPVNPALAASSSTLHAPHPSLDVAGADFPVMDDMSADAPMPQATAEYLRGQEAEEAAAAKRDAEKLEADEAMSEAEREAAEMALMSRTQRLAALHEKIIKQEAQAAQPVDLTVIRKSPALQPTVTNTGKIAEIQQLHLAQQAASGETHTVVEKAEKSVAPQVGRGRIAEMKRLHEQKIKDEAEAKSKQDQLFSGKYLKSGGKGGK